MTTIYGTRRHDRISGTDAENETIYGLGGNDILDAGPGHFHPDRFETGNPWATWTTLDGGRGADTLFADGGFNILLGGDGNDRLFGAIVPGDSDLKGGRGNDLLVTAEGLDLMYGGQGRDTFEVHADASHSTFDVVFDFEQGKKGDKLALFDAGGGRLTFAAFDTNGDRRVDDADDGVELRLDVTGGSSVTGEGPNYFGPVLALDLGVQELLIIGMHGTPDTLFQRDFL